MKNIRNCDWKEIVEGAGKYILSLNVGATIVEFLPSEEADVPLHTLA